MKPTHLFSLVFLGVLSAIDYSSARSTPYVKVPAHAVQKGSEYAWLVDTHEQARLSALLAHDVSELDLLGFYANAPPHPCPRCGKETELIDWVYTALERGVHSREWIVQALREGRLSKKGAHDVYCSRCGHLTAFQDPSGDEGGMPDISCAPRFDRSTRTFGPPPECLPLHGEHAMELEQPVGGMQKREPAAGVDPDSDSVGVAAKTWSDIWNIKRSDAPEFLQVLVEDIHPTPVCASTNDHDDGSGHTANVWAHYWLVKKGDEPDFMKARPRILSLLVDPSQC